MCLLQQTHVCHDKTVLLSQQIWKYACHNQIFVVTKVCLSWKNFCHDKHIFLDKYLQQQKYFVATNIILSWKKFCHDKRTFDATKELFCHNKHVFVTTKMILAAACASDSADAMSINQNWTCANKTSHWLLEAVLTDVHSEQKSTKRAFLFILFQQLLEVAHGRSVNRNLQRRHHLYPLSTTARSGTRVLSEQKSAKSPSSFTSAQMADFNPL